MPKISIITPTKDREVFLPSLWACIQAQTIQDIEWLVHDSSAAASPFMEKLKETDDRVHYMRDPDPKNPMKIGPKRNALIKKAGGDYIIHMDDDDYYAPRYVEATHSLLVNNKADIVKLFGFFLYHQRTGSYGYWDLERAFPLHFIMHPHRDDFLMGPKLVNTGDEWGYGFSYVYHRKVWEKIPFEDENHGEDQPFATAALKIFKGVGMQDREFLALHVIHGSNSSVSFPQQLLSASAASARFPGFVPIVAPVHGPALR